MAAVAPLAGRATPRRGDPADVRDHRADRARLAGLAPATTQVEHAINVLGLCAFPVLVLYTRHATDAPVNIRTAAWCLVPAGVYLIAIPARHALGTGTRVPFAWMLPVILGFTAISAITLGSAATAATQRSCRRSGSSPSW